ncbi:hypothetical protein FOA52_011623 [Chlamydomonas sp. UWO 241]|nr:hypothetical protein FOA52_011623 [Chlamydomonas sp. UWO 241]
MLFSRRSQYNHVRVVEIPDHPDVDPAISGLRGCRVLVLDAESNVHSVYRPYAPVGKVSGNYWDLLASLHSTLPSTLRSDGPIGILGLAAGTAAHMVAAHYPKACMDGWELDGVVVEAARAHMGLARLEESGQLVCHVGDALVPSASVEGGFSGIMVDIYLGGTVPSSLHVAPMWRCIGSRVRAGGRVIANLGQSPVGLAGHEVHADSVGTLRALAAMAEALGELSLVEVPNDDGETANTVALSGPHEVPLGSVREQAPQLLRTYRGDVVDELLEDSKAATTSFSLGGSSRWGQEPSPGSPSYRGRETGVSVRAAAQREARETEIRAKDAEFHRKMEARMEQSVEKKEAEFQSMYADVLEGLTNSSGIMGDTQYTLEHAQRIRSQKKAALYEEWDTEVFSKIQDRLQGAVDTRTTRQVETRLQSQMDEYLHATNTKLGVFRDVVDVSDYNPLAAHAHSIVIRTGDIRDPVKRDVLKTQREKALMDPGYKEGPVGKQTLDNTLWGALQIKATPYGHCVDETGNYIVQATPEAAAKARASRVQMDHYNYPNRDNGIAKDEAGRPGKSTKAAIAGAGPNGIFGVIQQTGIGAPADTWCDAKGKATPPGPEVTRGRRDLTDTIQQRGNAYVDGVTGGDRWLEAKGKSMPPGPEERRGRKGLTETIQQRGNPYVDGKIVGDMWLEAKGKAPVSAAAAGSSIASTLGRSDGAPQPVVGGKFIPKGLPQVETHLQFDGSVTTKV